MSERLTHCVEPSAFFAQLHGTVEVSWTQPRNRCVYVWLTQRYPALSASSRSVSASLPPFSLFHSSPAPALNTMSSVKPCLCSQEAAYCASAAVMRIGVSVSPPPAQSKSPGVQLRPVSQRASGAKTSSTWTAK